MANGQKQKAAAAVTKLQQRGIDCFAATTDGQVWCHLCSVELAYRDMDTVKRHLSSQRHHNSTHVADLKKQIQVGKAS